MNDEMDRTVREEAWDELNRQEQELSEKKKEAERLYYMAQAKLTQEAKIKQAHDVVTMLDFAADTLKDAHTLSHEVVDDLLSGKLPGAGNRNPGKNAGASVAEDDEDEELPEKSGREPGKSDREQEHSGREPGKSDLEQEHSGREPEKSDQSTGPQAESRTRITLDQLMEKGGLSKERSGRDDDSIQKSAVEKASSQTWEKSSQKSGPVPAAGRTPQPPELSAARSPELVMTKSMTPKKT